MESNKLKRQQSSSVKEAGKMVLRWRSKIAAVYRAQRQPTQNEAQLFKEHLQGVKKKKWNDKPADMFDHI